MAPMTHWPQETCRHENGKRKEISKAVLEWLFRWWPLTRSKGPVSPRWWCLWDQWRAASASTKSCCCQRLETRQQARLQSEGQRMKQRLTHDFCWFSVNATSRRLEMYLKLLSCFSIEINFADEIMKRHFCFQSWDKWWYMYIYILKKCFFLFFLMCPCWKNKIFI